jgi:hypothetical protein
VRHGDEDPSGRNSAAPYRASHLRATRRQALVDLVRQQTRHNLETLTALAHAVDWERVARAVDWDRVVRIQGAYVRASFERATRLTQRYVAVAQAVTVAAADVAQRQARKAA